LYLNLMNCKLKSCNDFLDVVPDNVATLDFAFRNRTSAERFLFTCYSYMPDHSTPEVSANILTGEDLVTIWNIPEPSIYPTVLASDISRGMQNVNEPYMNYWDGRNGAFNGGLFQGIRDCNIFIEEINNVVDMDQVEIDRWIAEVKTLKAYYHFYLLKLYGPVPIIKENFGLNASPDEVDIYREPVSEVVDYIVELLDEAALDLPPEVFLQTEELGRITKPIALAIKAKALLWDASPLFNGNTDYASFIDNRGKQLISQQYDPEKWIAVRDAAKEAIDAAREGGHEIYYFQELGGQSFRDSTKVKLSIRGAFSERWNSEIIWGDTQGTATLQRHSQPVLYPGQDAFRFRAFYHHSATLRMAELFYTENGIPIDEDPAYFNRSEWYDLMLGDDDHRFYIGKNYETIKLNFNREARFYGNLGFDGSTWLSDAPRTDNDLPVLKGKKDEISDFFNTFFINYTGYYPKKYLNWNTTMTATTWSPVEYSFPIIRLADLYLIYAEALNEIEGPSGEIFQYLDEIRLRAGLDGVTQSWANSTNPGKPNTQNGLREIIRHERLIELAFEGKRVHDLRRWKLAREYFNKPMKGLNYQGRTSEDYYQQRTIRTREFRNRDYLWPIMEAQLFVNNNLMQNPGWE
jgi:hypothetical protein